MIRAHVLPYAAPGIITGLILSIARALGEAAPLILVGATTGRLASEPHLLDLNQLQERFTALPIVVTVWTKNPQDGLRRDRRRRHRRHARRSWWSPTPLAILLRNRYEKKRT